MSSSWPRSSAAKESAKAARNVCFPQAGQRANMTANLAGIAQGADGEGAWRKPCPVFFKENLHDQDRTFPLVH